jgi:hypothetical protein
MKLDLIGTSLVSSDKFYKQILKQGVWSKQFFIVPTVAHNYKMIGMLKTIKIPTIAPSSTVYRTLAQQVGMPP